MGIKTVAVYSDADANAMHVREADQAYRVGPTPAQESYLRMDTSLGVIKDSGAASLAFDTKARATSPSDFD